MSKSSLILEGGGMRGMYTSGVLDAFMDNNLYIDNIYAVSAGCYNALPYLSRQKGMAYRINVNYLRDKRFINVRRVFFNKSAINHDFILNDVFNELDPFDFDTFSKVKKHFCAVCTDCDSGEAIYPLVEDLKNDVCYVKASAALPLFSDLIKVGDKTLIDGGVSDSVPIKKALEDGYKKNVIILTQPKGFVLGDNRLIKFYKTKYRKYPLLVKKMVDRKNIYNETLAFIEELESKNEVIVIRPRESLNISNLEKNMEKINKIYDMGYSDGLQYVNKIKEFIGYEKSFKK